MSLPSYAVDFRGHPACPCQVIWIPAYEHELQRRGLLGPGEFLQIYQLIGDYSGSGNTHLLGGVGDYLDLPGDNDEAVWVARQMGADPTWHRFFNWDGKGGIEHDHSVLRGCPHLAQSALDQVWAVDHNGDGLIGDAPDPGPRPLSGRTWEQGIEWAKEQEMADYAEQLDQIIKQGEAAKRRDVALRKAVKALAHEVEDAVSDGSATVLNRVTKSKNEVLAALDELEAGDL